MNRRNFPQWISHRGYYKHQVENTLGAFDEAVNLRFDRLETDVRTTKDGQLVLCHDTSFQRVGGPKEDVWTLAKAELQRSRLKYHSKIVFFDDFCDRYSASDWIFDIKPEQGDKTIKALKDWAEYHDAHNLLTRQAWFLCWDKAHEDMILEFLPNATILVDEKSCWRAGLSLFFGLPFLGGFKKGKIYTLIPKLWGKELFKKKIVEKIHKRGAKALAYLPASEKDLQAAVDAGFDYIITEEQPLRRKFFPSDNRNQSSDTRRRHPSDQQRRPSSPDSRRRGPSQHSSQRRPHGNKPYQGNRPQSSSGRKTPHQHNRRNKPH